MKKNIALDKKFDQPHHKSLALSQDHGRNDKASKSFSKRKTNKKPSTVAVMTDWIDKSRSKNKTTFVNFEQRPYRNY